VKGPERESARAAEPIFRPMEATDLPAVMEIDALCLPRPWSERVWREELESRYSLYLVLEEKDREPGMDPSDRRAIYAQIGVRRVLDELHVTTLAVRPERRRRGYARALLERVLAAFPEARRVQLEVRPTNTAARTLYESLGFVTTGLRPRYYGDEDALLMTLDLGEGR
jgi:[ribosomal protein S18]-alanine N-acetyltransferase